MVFAKSSGLNQTILKGQSMAVSEACSCACTEFLASGHQSPNPSALTQHTLLTQAYPWAPDILAILNVLAKFWNEPPYADLMISGWS